MISLLKPASLSEPLRIGAVLSWFCAALVLTLSVPSQAGEPTDQKEAAAFLQDLGDAAITVLAGAENSGARQEKAVEDMLRQNLDLETMGRFVLGPEWRKASAEQRTAYVDLFSEFVVRTYAQRLGGYGGQQFEVDGTSQAGKNDALVVTSITSNDGSPPVKAGWRVKTAKDGSLKIVDVIVEGVSMLQTQRSEFDSVVRRSGLDGLMALLEERLAKLPKTAG